MAREKRATWFKLFAHQRAIIDAVSDEDAGQALKCALAYFEAGDSPTNLSPTASIVFAALKQSADEAIKDYASSVAFGKKGGLSRGKGGLAPLTEEEDRTEGEEEGEDRTEGEGRAITRAPSLSEVEEYCRQRNSGVDPQRFYDFYATSDWLDKNGKLINWRQKVISWEREDGKRRPEKDWHLPNVTVFSDDDHKKRSVGNGPNIGNAGKDWNLSGGVIFDGS